MTGSERELGDFWRRALRIAFALMLACAGVLYIAPARGPALACGLLLGGTVSVLRFNLRYRALAGALTAGPLIRARLLGYAVNGLALAAAFLRPETASPWSTIAGLFCMNVSVVIAELLTGTRATESPPAPGDLGPS